jgi:hypothetical protein
MFKWVLVVMVFGQAPKGTGPPSNLLHLAQANRP